MLDEAEQRRVADAVRAAEATTDGEIATVIAPQSGEYRDVLLWWAIGAAAVGLTVHALWPGALHWIGDRVTGGWEERVSDRSLLAILAVLVAAKFVATLLVLRSPRLLTWLTPGFVKTARVRRAALTAFRLGTEGRTAQANGVLIYVSVLEHRAEIVADRGVHALVTPETWGDAMATLLAGLKAGRPGDGFVAAIERIGAVLATHFPRTGRDPNEMPDHLVIL